MLNIGNGSANYDLTSAEDGVLFDIFANGSPTRVAWTDADAAIAFLALDRNGNGIVDDASELFGNFTRKSDGTRAANGFEALIDLDGGTAVSDGRISPSDASYSLLRLWVDGNHNGLSESTELMTLSSANVRSIFTSYRESRRVDKHGNLFRYRGVALVVLNNQEMPRVVYDVILRTAN